MSMYIKKQFKLYKMLEDIYYLNDYDKNKARRYYEQIAILYPCNFINEYIEEVYKNDKRYYHKKNTHIMCDNFEYTKLVVSKSCIKINTNIRNPNFIDLLSSISNNLFVCDFNYQKYFWLDKNNQKDLQITK